ncbi:MAG: sugar phosphate isomerase/epimerase [Candidatus Sumerlaeota bacterium]|nr:sugar phosphate isomerase/epimerase [Candidatus Sumerlaeota bacterium]
MTQTRRRFLKSSAAGLAGAALISGRKAPAAETAPAAGGKLITAASLPVGIHIGSRMNCCGGFEGAKKGGIEGVEIGVGPGKDEKLSIVNPAEREKQKGLMKSTGVVVCSLSLDGLNSYPVATHPKGMEWIEQAIDSAKDLGAVSMLIPFFGKANLLSGKELNKELEDALVGRMKELAPKAKAAGVILGIENTCSGKQNLQILDKIGSDFVKCYYDIGNSTGNGYDVPAELRALKGRLALIHFKDGNSFLGEGKVKMEPIGEALKAIGYKGWIVLETGNPTKNAEADGKRNADYIKKLLGL